MIHRRRICSGVDWLCLAGRDIGHYRLGTRLGSGKFGTVYSGSHRRSGDAVAIKVEPEDARLLRLPNEARVYRSLGRLNCPRMRWFGRAHGHLALVMDRVGPSLRSIHREASLRLSAETVQRVGLQLLHRLEALHSTGWMHLDIKPSNVAVTQTMRAGARMSPDDISWTLLDFGLARRWCDPHTGEHTPDVARRGAVGTGTFASLTNHKGEPLGRRDDVESLAFTLAYLHEGRLPWSHVEAPTKRERFALVLAEKRRASVEEIQGGLPDTFADFLHAARQLRYDEPPDYELLRRLLRGASHGVG